MFEIVVIDVDDECVPLPKNPKKVVANVNYKFQNFWGFKMPKVEPIFNEGGLVFAMRCHVCTKIERKEKKIGC
jgi:hypothetical protein